MHTCIRARGGTRACATCAASDAVQALEHWRLHAPDVVLLEPVLLRGDGLALCRHIRESSATPVLLVTTRGSDDEVQRGLAAAASDYVLKPLSPRELIGFSLNMLLISTFIR